MMYLLKCTLYLFKKILQIAFSYLLPKISQCKRKWNRHGKRYASSSLLFERGTKTGLVASKSSEDRGGRLRQLKFEDRAEGARERESLREPQNNRKVPITLDQVLICVCMRGKLWCQRRLLRVPWTARRSNPVNPKGNQS